MCLTGASDMCLTSVWQVSDLSMSDKLPSDKSLSLFMHISDILMSNSLVSDGSMSDGAEVLTGLCPTRLCPTSQ